jgi:parallel beta-helix repeat protein
MGARVQNVRIMGLNCILLSALIIVSFMAPIVTISYLPVGTVSAGLGTENCIVVLGKATSYTINTDPYPPWLVYSKGDKPVEIYAVRGIGASPGGGVIVGGFAFALRNNRWDNPSNPSANLDILFENLVHWVNPTATKVAWCDYSGYNVYNEPNTICSHFAASISDKGTAVTDLTVPITNASLAPFENNVLLIPQLELGDAGTGGNPSLLPDNVVQAIDNFVENNGGILVILDGGDTFGYNYCNVGNKILKSLFRASGGYYFQSDSILDDDNFYGGNYQPLLDVDNTTSVGAAYQTSTGQTTIGLYSVCSLAPIIGGVSVSISPRASSGANGVTITYAVTVSNNEDVSDNFNLTVNDNAGWSPTVLPTSLAISPWEPRTATLSVTVPSNAIGGTIDNIKVTATSQTNNTISGSASCTAKSVSHVPIYINGNDNFTPSNGVVGGSGVENDPYIIENWDISAENVNGIEIVNTTSYFFVRNCYVHDGKSNYTHGISLITAINGKIENNFLKNNYICIYLSASNNRIENCSIENSSFGIHLAFSSSNIISNNNLVGNEYSISLNTSSSNIISNNLLRNGGVFWFWQSSNNILSGNVWENYSGSFAFLITLYNFSNNNIITSNIMNSNLLASSVYIENSVNNLIFHNNFINNFSPPIDNEANHWDNGYPSGGNYWSDYAGTDNNGDGIGDTPYSILGGSNQDRYPLINPFEETPWTGWAAFGLENLYAVHLEKNLALNQGLKLVARFYDYSNNFESEVVIESITPPQSVVENENVPHPPQGALPVRTAVKKAELVLTTENTENVISIIASFTVTQSDLRNESIIILRNWAGNPPVQPYFRMEIMDKLKMWSSAPL